MRSTKAFFIGAGAAYLFDPGHGKRRRRELRDRSRKLVRVVERKTASKAKFTTGRIRGALAVSRLGLRASLMELRLELVFPPVELAA